MRNTPKILIGLGLVAALGGTALAASPDGQSERWKQLDTNANSLIEKSEFMARANQKFTQMDRNGDGFASEDERREARAEKRAERTERAFGNLDANGDGTVSEDEYTRAREARTADRQARRLAKRDITGDGVVDEADKQAWEAKRAERRAERQQSGETRREGKRERRKGMRGKADANGDGVVDFAEHSAAAEKMFSWIDQNGDDVLSADEMKRGKHKRRRSRR